MHQLKRSTNERVLARHHALLKRFPAIEPFPNDAVSDGDSDNTNFGVLGADPDEDDDDRPHAVVRTTPVVTRTPIPPPVKTVPARPIATQLTPPLPKVPLSSVPPNTVPAQVLTPVVATPSTSSVVPTSTPATTSASSSPVISQTANRGVSTTPSGTVVPESSPSASDTTSSKSSGGISSGAIGGIVAIIAILALIAIAFFVRKNAQRRRALKRNTWGAGLVPSLENKRQTMYGGDAQPVRSVSPYGSVPEHERLANVPPSQMSQTPAPQALSVPPALATASSTFPPDVYGAYSINAPASAYNSNPSSSPLSPFVTPSVPAPSVRSVTPAGELAIVARTFIPSLPDELHISNAEQIRIVNAYDDGWALCANARGEQGVVPLECLDRRGGAPAEMQLQPHSGIGGAESNRASRRMSSLAPAASGTY